MQEARVRSLVQEDPHAEAQPSLCTMTTEPVLWSPGAATMKPASPRALAPQQEKPLK